MATAKALHYIRFGLCCPPVGLVVLVPVSILRLALVVVVPAAILQFVLVVTVPSIIIHRLVFVWRQPPYFWLLRQPPL